MTTKPLKTTIKHPWTGATFTVTLPCLTDFFNESEADTVVRFSKVIFIDFAPLLASYYDYPKNMADAVALHIAERLFSDTRCFWDPQYALTQFVCELQAVGEHMAYNHADRKRVLSMVPLMDRINKYRQIDTP